MEIINFIKEHKKTWTELEKLLERFYKQKKTISSADIDHLTHLYKKASAHLAYLRTYFPQDEMTSYLNELVIRAHNVIYQEQFKSSHQLAYFFKAQLPALLQKRQLFVGLACLIFCIGALSGFSSIQQDQLNLYQILPQHIAENIDPHRVGEGHNDINNPVISTKIMINNIKVAILAFVGGITFGVMTIYLLFYNGLIIGALAAVFWRSDNSYVFWAYILPHGIIELTAIFIAGGAGLYMGYRMLVPGRYAWKYQFLQSAKESAQLLLATFPLFVIAGTIEGYITPSTLTLTAKYSFAAFTLLLLISYYLYSLLATRHNASLDLSSR